MGPSTVDGTSVVLQQVGQTPATTHDHLGWTKLIFLVDRSATSGHVISSAFAVTPKHEPHAIPTVAVLYDQNCIRLLRGPLVSRLPTAITVRQPPPCNVQFGRWLHGRLPIDQKARRENRVLLISHFVFYSIPQQILKAQMVHLTKPLASGWHGVLRMVGM